MIPKRWDEVLQERLNPLFARRCIHTRQMTVARIEMAKGAIVPLHSHHNDQISMIESGTLLFRMDGREIPVGPGQILEIPANLPHEAEALEDCVATDVFAPSREDWIRGDDAYLRR